MPYHVPGLSLQKLRGDPALPAVLAGVAARFGGKAIGRIAGRVGRALGSRAGRRAAGAGVAVATTLPFLGGGGPPPTGMVPRPGFKGRLQRFLPGGATGFEQCPPGKHINKAWKRWQEALAEGRDVKEPNVVNLCVSSRRMNVANVRALRRASRRGRGFVKTFRRLAAQFGVKRSARPRRRAK